MTEVKIDLRVCVCGGREFTDAAHMNTTLDQVAEYCDTNNFNLIVVEGEARGADRLAKAWAEANDIPIRAYKAEWSVRNNKHQSLPGTFNPKAGARRNYLMANNCDKVIAFWDGVKVHGTPEEIADGKGKGSGTYHMISRATKAEFNSDIDKDVPINVIMYDAATQPSTKKVRVEADFSFLDTNDVGLAQSESAVAQQQGEIF